MIYKFIALVLLVSVSGCATMSKDECRTATRDTWVSVGFDDGRHGRSENNIRNHQKACAGISSPDLAAYQEGHVRGVAQYCVEQTGYSTGIRGRGKNNICARNQFPGYHEAYHFGQGIYRSEQEIKRLANDLQQATQARVDAEHEIKVVEADLVSPGLSTRQRRQLLEQAKTLRDDLYQHDAPIVEIEKRIYIALDAHNDNLRHNPYEQRQPLEFPTISIEERPDPQPQIQGPREPPQHRRNHPGILPESFVVDTQLSGILHSSPKSLLRNKQAHPVSKRGRKYLAERDGRFLSKGYYHLFRFPNKGAMKVRWFGYAGKKKKNIGEVRIYYWHKRRFVAAKVTKTKRKRGYVFEVQLPSRAKHLYVLLKSGRGQLFTDYIFASPVQ